MSDNSLTKQVFAIGDRRDSSEYLVRITDQVGFTGLCNLFKDIWLMWTSMCLLRCTLHVLGQDDMRNAFNCVRRDSVSQNYILVWVSEEKILT